MSKKLFIKLARSAISDAIEHTSSINEDTYLEEFPDFSKHAATFVTLTINGQLRGCIGSLNAERSLFEDISSNARAAALTDPRFPRLTAEEFSKVKVEISLLTEPKELVYKSINDLKSKVTKKDGVILKRGSAQATFLPQVWAQIPSFEGFFSQLCEKAGLDGMCLQGHPQIYLYQVVKFQE